MKQRVEMDDTGKQIGAWSLLHVGNENWTDYTPPGKWERVVGSVKKEEK